MKKIFLLLLLFAGMASAQIVNIPDAFFKLKLVSASATDTQNYTAKNFSDQWMTIDANGDGEIQLTEAQAVKLLIVGHYAITDLTGLSSFSNLQSLQIKANQAASLNLNALTQLTTLSIDSIRNITVLNINNPNLTSMICVGLYNLSSLTVSNSPNMTSLSVIECGLTTMNINGLTNLTELNCLENKLTNLNGLSTNLTKLNCSYNQLTSLNLTTLTNLTELDCSGNQLINFNTSGLTNLTDLNCSANLLTDLTVSALPNLVNLNCSTNNFTNISLSGLTHLTTLNCGGNNQLVSVSLNNLPALQDFKVVNGVDMQTNPIGHLSNLTLSGLPNLQKLDCSNGILTSLDLNGLANLTEVSCSRNQITSLNVRNLPNLQKLVCDTNPITNLDVSNMPNLTELRCAGGYATNGQIIGHLNTLNVSGSTNLKRLSCSSNLLTSLNLNGLVNLEELYCNGFTNNVNGITNLNVNDLTSLRILQCMGLKLTSLNVSNLTNLTDLYCAYNRITSLDLTGLVNLKTLNYEYNQLSNLNLVNLPSLNTLNCANNQLTTLNVLNLTNLKELNCSVNQLTTLNLSGLSALESLSYSYNQIALSNVSGLSANLKSLYCDNNELTSLDVSNLPNLDRLSCANNLLTNIDVSTLTNLKFLDISTNELATIDVSNLMLLEYLDVYHNQLTALNLNGLTTLKQLAYSENVIPNLDISFLVNLEFLICDSTQSTVLDVSNLTKLNNLSCANNQLTTLDVTALPNLTILQCQDNQITTLDLSNAVHLLSLSCYNNQLETVYVKNGTEEQSFEFSNNPNLTYICADESQIETIQTQLNNLGMTTTVSNSYCSFTPGGNHNTITGIAIFDANNNGCDAGDVVNPFVKLGITDGSQTGATVTNINGTYHFFTNAGDYVIAPNTENPGWFSFSPASADFTFANDNNNISTQNFCIAAIGLHKDIEVVFAPLESARPGFNASYKIVFKNKGNQMLSGAVTLDFDDARTDFVSSTPAFDTSAPNLLSWNFTNLMPFENRSIELTLNTNGPMETPAVNNGDILSFTASVTPVSGDEFPSDNTFSYNQTVIGSFDPNDIICLEGSNVSPAEIGNYLHYMVNFENTGTAAAENIVVKLEINPDEFDINSLQVMNASHPAFAEVRGNVVEFKFANINLQPTAGDPPVNGHGNILFKMKSNNTLHDGDLVKNKANIFFDYNFPIVTNDAETVFESLNTDEFANDRSVVVYPNPVQNKLQINCANTIRTVELYDMQGRILQAFKADKMQAQLDISNQSKGIYFVKIITEKGKKVKKIIKE